MSREFRGGEQEETIVAIATAAGEGGIGIIRVSGSRAIDMARRLFVPAGKLSSETIAAKRQFLYGWVKEPDSQGRIDEAILLIMPAPHSYTREDVVEFHCHGGPSPLRRILDVLMRQGIRLAEPGEFTKRAFLNGRLDLPQAEAVMDVIRAKTDASLKMAVGNLAGGLSLRIRALRDDLLAMIARLEAAIDFPEEDIEELASTEAGSALVTTREVIAELLATAQTGRILREGLATVIIGKPNVGKSSLLNALLREKRAIVTDVPGTTRDIIEEYLNVRGIPLKIIDTAGIRETEDLVERIGVERARRIVDTADLVLLLLDASSPLSREDKEVLSLLPGREAVILLNKSDLPPVLTSEELAVFAPGRLVLKISVTEGSGLDQLEDAIAGMVYRDGLEPVDAAFVNTLRQADLLRQTDQCLIAALAAIDAGMPPDCLVVDLREAWEQLGKITGDTVGEDIIDQIFSRFCIGK
ncbi:MAG TPA: tRNA uridine-5-carboxymethylaminomethyl(34) synthesis GTPase MnmE [Patescibacteria group bacterium]|nr:tRNA uridine-5-carboxymethylaminomethyl(34) synthesis GTPase MnmE [Patescibacteria group bacterium]